MKEWSRESITAAVDSPLPSNNSINLAVTAGPQPPPPHASLLSNTSGNLLSSLLRCCTHARTYAHKHASVHVDEAAKCRGSPSNGFARESVVPGLNGSVMFPFKFALFCELHAMSGALG